MDLFIANTTKQDHDFIFRIPESKRTYHQMIRAGQQTKVHTGTKVAIDSIVDQHARYGLKPAAEVLNGRGFVGLCYSTDVPVKMDTFMVAYEQNDEALIADNLDRRKNEAAAIHSNMASHNPDALQGVELEVVEIPKTIGGDVNVNNTISVGDPARTEQSTARGRRGR